MRRRRIFGGFYDQFQTNNHWLALFVFRESPTLASICAFQPLEDPLELVSESNDWINELRE